MFRAIACEGASALELQVFAAGCLQSVQTEALFFLNARPFSRLGLGHWTL